MDEKLEFYLKRQFESIGDKITITHQEIADLTSLTRETVSMAILKLKSKKLIDTQTQSIQVRNYRLLYAESTLQNEDQYIAS